MAAQTAPPSDDDLSRFLGAAFRLWPGILEVVEAACGPLERQWQPAKAEFGRMCLLRHKKRTLLYLTPGRGEVWVAIVLGERAHALAMASPLPAAIKQLFSDAKPYAEGRGIRFPVHSLKELPLIAELVRIKTTPP